MKKTTISYLLIAIVFFGLGFLVGKESTEKEVVSRQSFDKEGFVKSVQKIITGKILEIKKDSLVLTKNDNQVEIKIGPEAKISLLIRVPGGEPTQVGTGSGLSLPPPEVNRRASLDDLRVGDRATITITETPSGGQIGTVISVERK